jgi:adenylate kinase
VCDPIVKQPNENEGADVEEEDLRLALFFLHECKTPCARKKNCFARVQDLALALVFCTSAKCKPLLRTCKKCTGCKKMAAGADRVSNVNLDRISKILGLDPKVPATTNLNLDEVFTVYRTPPAVHEIHPFSNTTTIPIDNHTRRRYGQMDPNCKSGRIGSGPDDAAANSSRRRRNRRRRARPNVLITGTPGTGKTALATLLSVRTQWLRYRHDACPCRFVYVFLHHPLRLLFIVQEQLDLRHVNVGEIVQAHKCYEGRDEALDTYVLDEDKLLDLLEPILEDFRQNREGVVLDYHACDFFPERYFDLVLVLQCHTDILYDRLSSRNYSELKRSENVTAEIMHVIWEEAQQSYDPHIVHAVPSNTIQDMDSNVDRVRTWMEQWIRDHGEEEEASGSSEDNDDALEDDDDDDDIST